MSSREHLPIDLADPDDIRDKLPQVRELYTAKQRELERLAQDVEHWGALLNLLARLVGERGVEVRPVPARAYGGGHAKVIAPARKRAPAQEKAVKALERVGRPMGPTALHRFMEDEGMDAPSNANALGATLWTAVKAGRIKKTPEGLYAPLDWEPDQNELIASRDGTVGETTGEEAAKE